MLESDEAARRLGVKVTTLYAYVSRGLLVSHPAASGRRSLFDVDEVERLARRSRQGKAVETRHGHHHHRHHPAHRRRARSTGGAGPPTWPPSGRYEEAAEWLWGVDGEAMLGEARPAPTRPPAPTPTGRPWPWAARRTSGPSDRIRWAVVMAGALDPLRADLRPEAVTRTARRLAASMVEVLAPPAVARGDRSTPTRRHGARTLPPTTASTSPARWPNG